MIIGMNYNKDYFSSHNMASRLNQLSDSLKADPMSYLKMHELIPAHRKVSCL